MELSQQSSRAVTAAIVVAALGYFVDIYDLILFAMIRTSSLRDLGLSGAALTEVGGHLMNMQMGGMLVGGVLWGVLGDRRGRLSVLFGSIIMYSLANIANGFVETIPQYEVLRVIAGIGLAGELGAGITLVSEIMHKQKRGYGTTIVAAVGILGAVLAYFIQKEFGWRNAFFIGGGMGLLLLLLRISVYESGMYASMKEAAVTRGNFFSFFTSPDRFGRYLRCILIGVPLWYVVGILCFYAPEFATVLGVTPKVDAGTAVLYCYAGLSIGDFASGFLSQMLQSRKKVVFIFLGLEALFISLYLLGVASGDFAFYMLCGMLGIASGYWAVFVTIASEQFGTNLRATATTTVPNFVRGTVPLLNWGFLGLRESLGPINTAAILGAGVLIIALLSARGLKETFGKDLNYLEAGG